jgi:hypothetical protein
MPNHSYWFGEWQPISLVGNNDGEPLGIGSAPESRIGEMTVLSRAGRAAGLTAALLAAVSLTLVPSEAYAKKRHHHWQGHGHHHRGGGNGAGIALGLLGGALAGAAIASGSSYYRPYSSYPYSYGYSGYSYPYYGYYGY